MLETAVLPLSFFWSFGRLRGAERMGAVSCLKRVIVKLILNSLKIKSERLQGVMRRENPCGTTFPLSLDAVNRPADCYSDRLGFQSRTVPTLTVLASYDAGNSVRFLSLGNHVQSVVEHYEPVSVFFDRATRKQVKFRRVSLHDTRLPTDYGLLHSPEENQAGILPRLSRLSTARWPRAAPGSFRVATTRTLTLSVVNHV